MNRASTAPSRSSFTFPSFFGPELKQRIEREDKAISALQHANICTLYDIGSEADTNFVVIEYLEDEGN
jgi:serine/threonine protein kinase